MIKHRDYPELEGKEIAFVDEGGYTERLGIVVGCNYDIGITIVDKDNSNHYIMCYIGPQMSEQLVDEKAENWPAMFYSAVRQIKSGIIKSDHKPTNHILLLSGIKHGRSPSRATCPFGQ